MTARTRRRLETAVAKLPAGLREHVLRVVEEAQRLARRHGVDEERATLAALGHDLARAWPAVDLLRAASDAGLRVSRIERSEPVLLHGPVSARIMSERYGIEDAEVLSAAHHHTTARARMGALERLLYVADKIEPAKARKDAAVAAARELAEESLEAALRVLLERQIGRALERGWPLHPDTVAARNELVVDRS